MYCERENSQDKRNIMFFIQSCHLLRMYSKVSKRTVATYTMILI